MYVEWSRRKILIIFPILTILAMLGTVVCLHRKTPHTYIATCNCSLGLALGAVETFSPYNPGINTGLLAASLL